MRKTSHLSVAVVCCLGILLANLHPTVGFASGTHIFRRPNSLSQCHTGTNRMTETPCPVGSGDSPFRRRRRKSSVLSSANTEEQEHSTSLTRSDKSRNTAIHQNVILSTCLAFTILFVPLQAQAGFGPSGGATTSSTPGVSKVNLQDLSPKKLQQLIDNTTDERRLNEFQSQLDAIIESIVNTLNQATSDDEGAEEAEEAQQNEGQEENAAARVAKAVKSTLPGKNDAEEQRLEKAKSFQVQIADRERLLDKLEAQPWWYNYFAAFCGSVASVMVMHPVDTIKTRLMVRKSNAKDERASMFKDLYEGLSGNILKEGFPSALYLGVYEAVKGSLLHGKLSIFWASLFGAGASGAVQNAFTGDPTYLLSIYLASGAVGEVVGSTVRAPAETIKSMVQTEAASSTAEAFGMVVRPEGRENVFRAWSASALRDVPFGAIQLALFELIKAYILNNPNIEFDSSTLQSEAIIGAFAGSVGSFVTSPLDVITTRIITQAKYGDGGEPLGIVEMTKVINREGGLAAFFAGWQARVLYWGPAISLFLTCYCTVRQLGVKLDLFS